MVKFKLDEKTLILAADKILGRLAFLIQRELIERFPESFKNRIIVAREGAAWIVGSNFKILKFYDKGTRPHVIEPKVKDALAFKWSNAPGIPGANGKFFFKKVYHPGTKGKKIIESLEKDTGLLNQFLERAIRDVLK